MMLASYIQYAFLGIGLLFVMAFIGRLLAFIGTIFDLKIGGCPLGALYGFQCGYIMRWGSFWIGMHWSPYNRRLCINLLPCITVWIALPGGKTPQ